MSPGDNMSVRKLTMKRLKHKRPIYKAGTDLVFTDFEG